MARPLWKGAISFGLVTIPVELHTAIHTHRPRFRLLHAQDQSPVKYERICQREGKPVAWEDLIKGYEYERGRFVVVTKDDFRTAALEKTQTVDILDFVNADDIDDRYYDTPYYVVPGKGGTRGYAVLREAIRRSGRIGIGKIILREAQHLTALAVVDNVLVLTLMRYADELADISALSLPPAKDVQPKELDLAKQLIDNLATEWDPTKYTDEYQTNLMRVINAKLKGKPAALHGPAPQEKTAVVDLMEKLRQSLEGRRSPRRSATRARKRKRAA